MAVIDLKPHAGTRIQKTSLFVFKAPGFPQYIMVPFCLFQTNATERLQTFLVAHLAQWFTSEFHILHEQCYNNNKGNNAI